MPPRKRGASSAGETDEPLRKRRSLRHAAKGKPVVEKSSSFEPETHLTPVKKRDLKDRENSHGEAASLPEASKKRVRGSGQQSGSNTAMGPAPKPTPAKIKPNEDEESLRDGSEDPDLDSIPTKNPDAPRHEGEWYWLMKAEPESRLENGVDVKFSIDDLKARQQPEGWDARNHMRNMNAGDKAFFYHSSCKEPGIVGIMEIVKEFSEDKSARRPGPYYDPKSTKDNPKWDLVHVEFRKKFAAQISLKEIRELGKPGEPLEKMQMLKQSRLSVSRVSKEEWEALCEVADQKAQDAGLRHEEADSMSRNPLCWLEGAWAEEEEENDEQDETYHMKKSTLPTRGPMTIRNFESTAAVL
ncbi:hypothetical protein G7046_g1685 [Stylonectria norvegica]|nr:hypothetical protein G7046_g1685 [Stylonectria norvegica]